MWLHIKFDSNSSISDFENYFILRGKEFADFRLEFPPHSDAENFNFRQKMMVDICPGNIDHLSLIYRHSDVLDFTLIRKEFECISEHVLNLAYFDKLRFDSQSFKSVIEKLSHRKQKTLPSFPLTPFFHQYPPSHSKTEPSASTLPSLFVLTLTTKCSILRILSALRCQTQTRWVLVPKCYQNLQKLSYHRVWVELWFLLGR